MRKAYPDFLNKEEADKLLDISLGTILPLHPKFSKTDPNKEIIDKILNKLKEDFSFDIKNFSYYRTESKPEGHGWHIDTGNKGHMKWCEVGVSLLLQDGDTGGELQYKESENSESISKVEKKVYTLYAHTSNVYHMVTPHTGKRIALLMFI